MDIATAMAVAKSASKDPVSQGEVEEPKYMECMGHAWHWVEFMFIGFIIGGVALTIVTLTNDFLSIVWAICLLVSSLCGTGFVWNLATQKRLAKSTKDLARTIKEMVDANVEMAGEADRLAKNSEEFAHRLDSMRESSKLLDKSVKNLDGLEKQMSGLMDQQAAIVKKRQEHNEALEKLLEEQDKNAMDAAKNLLCDRVMDQFREADHDGDWKISKGAEWDAMEKLLETNGIKITPEFDHNADGSMTDSELEDNLTHLLEGHFDHLFSTLKKNRELQEQIEEKKRELKRKKMHL